MATLFEQPDGTESTQLPPELSLLISDCLEAPATFLVVQHLATALKAKRRCIILGLANGFDYYNAVLRKQGVQLHNERERGNCHYIDAMQVLMEISKDPSSPLPSYFMHALRPHLSQGCLVVFDDYSGFLHAGLRPLQLLKAFKMLQRAIQNSGASLLTVYHDDAFAPGKQHITRSANDDFLLRNILQLSDVWAQTRSLRAQMTGEIVTHRAPALIGQANLVTHSIDRPLQYKLEETGARYFAKGTDKGFL